MFSLRFYAPELAWRVLATVILFVCPGVLSRCRSKPWWDRDFGFSLYDSLESIMFQDKISCP